MQEDTLEFYMVGGCIRDYLLGRKPEDTDLAFAGTDALLLQRNPDARKIGPDGKHIFIVNGRECAPLDPAGPKADALRRDFTINALLVDSQGRLSCHPDSLADLRQGRIHPTTSRAMEADPLRLFRAARLWATLPSFHLTDACLLMMRKTPKTMLQRIAPERVGQEALKACAAEKPGNFLLALAQTGSLLPWFKELEGTDTIPAGPEAYHSRSVLGHTARIMNDTAIIARENGHGAAKDPIRTMAVWMALCHDLGKATTPPEEWPRHLGHESRGITMASNLCQRLRLPAVYGKGGKLAAELHMKAGIYHTLRIPTKVKLLVSLWQSHLLTPFLYMVAADSGDRTLPSLASQHLDSIKNVHLPPKWQNRGQDSAIHLHALRCQALKSAT